VDIAWKGGQLTTATIHSLNGNPVRLRYAQATKLAEIKKGEAIQWNGRM
jgi:alpha-L-fucosidase 2